MISEPSLSNSNTFVSNMRNPLYIWSDSLSQEPEQLEDDRSGGVMRTTERTASEQGSPTSGGGSGHHTSPTVVGIKSVSRVAENQQVRFLPLTFQLSSTSLFFFNSRTAIAGAIIGLLLVFYNSKNLNCIGVLFFLCVHTFFNTFDLSKQDKQVKPSGH